MSVNAAGIPSAKDQLARYRQHKGCLVCGFNKNVAALDFHHLVSGSKDQRLFTSSLAVLNLAQVREVRRCVVLCANCHRAYHAGQVTLPPIDLAAYYDEMLLLHDYPLDALVTFRLRLRLLRTPAARVTEARPR